MALAYGVMELSLLEESTSIFHWIVLNIPSGVGLGILFSSLALATQASAENRANCSAEERIKVKTMAAGLIPFFRVLGQACGIVVGQAAFTNGVSSVLGREAGRDAAALVGRIRDMPTAEREKTVHAFLQGLATVWWILLGLTVTMFVLTFITKDFSLKVRGDEVKGVEGAVEGLPAADVGVGGSVQDKDEISIETKGV